MYHVPSGSGSKLCSLLDLFKESSIMKEESVSSLPQSSSFVKNSSTSMGNNKDWKELTSESEIDIENIRKKGKESSFSESSMGNKEMYHVPSGSGSKLSSWLELFKESSSMKEESVNSFPQSSSFVENSTTSMGNNKDWKELTSESEINIENIRRKGKK
ncbi:hypothetical protein FRX31_004577 [Thalictrum thalictroides]|uniref:Uncharacterized protein n=1 Tax=Thalictrum thalictroides TaxID=46969 RepID=A0A7J6XA25_THATH|nr:hypothetical protein FRX31_004577 [Thalictrum thalictroides]